MGPEAEFHRKKCFAAFIIVSKELKEAMFRELQENMLIVT